MARDTVFAAEMIVLTASLAFASYWAETAFRADVSVAGRFVGIGGAGHAGGAGADPAQLHAGGGGASFSATQVLFIGVASLVLWSVFVFVQTVKHRDYFLDAPSEVLAQADTPEAAHEKPSNGMAFACLVLLLISLVAVVLLAKVLSYPLDSGIAAAGLPRPLSAS